MSPHLTAYCLARISSHVIRTPTNDKLPYYQIHNMFFPADRISRCPLCHYLIGSVAAVASERLCVVRRTETSDALCSDQFLYSLCQHQLKYSKGRYYDRIVPRRCLSDRHRSPTGGRATRIADVAPATNVRMLFGFFPAPAYNGATAESRRHRSATLKGSPDCVEGVCRTVQVHHIQSSGCLQYYTVPLIQTYAMDIGHTRARSASQSGRG